MSFRTVFLVLVILLVAAFAALNVDEFTRTSVLSIGVATLRVPLGLVMLALLGIAVFVFLASTLYQREIANRAEASRLADLRNFLEAQVSATQNREAAAEAVMTERFAKLQSALTQRIEQSDNTTAAHMGQLEDRLERRPGMTDPNRN
jgi:DNA anti-recombination protein RmuC